MTGSKSESLLRESAEYVPGGVHTSLRVLDPPVCIRRGSGAYIEDVDGRRLLDYHAAFGPFVLGHCYPDVVERVVSAIRETDLYGLGTTEAELELSRRIVEAWPGVDRVLLCNSGSEATFHAIRLARAFTERPKIVKFQGCFHGFHDYVLRNMLSAPEKVGTRDPGSAGMLDAAVDHTLVCRYNDLDDVRATLEHNAGEVAAVIVEPIPHNVGCLLPRAGFLEGLRRLCDEYGALLIFDEVITGFRHAVGGYQSICGVLPDITTMGKAMANGFPIAAIGGRRDVMDRFNTRPGGDVFFSGTYNGHAAGVAAALATMDVLEQERVHEQTFRLGDRMRTGLTEITAELGVPAVATGFGSVYVMYFAEGPMENYDDLLRNDAALFVEFRRQLNTRGIFELPLNLKRSHISFSHTDEDIDRTLEASREALPAALDALARS